MSKPSVRRAFVELSLRWFGYVTQKKLMSAFSISSAAASQEFGQWMRAGTFPMTKQGHLYLREGDASSGGRGGDPKMFLQLLRGQALAEEASKESERWFSGIQVVDADSDTTPPLNAEVVEAVATAIEDRIALSLEYRSRERFSEFIFSPSRLVYVRGRWHMRGYHHKEKEFRDIVLSRICGIQLMHKKDFISKVDKEWETLVSLKFKINPQLPPGMISSLRSEWSVSDDNIVEIRTRMALATYTRRRMTEIGLGGLCKWLEVSAAGHNC